MIDLKIIIGSRGSKLALAQSEYVKAKLLENDPSLDITIKIISTIGDRVLDKPLNQIGDKGLFTKEIEAQLLSGEIDIAVHSLKDLPAEVDEAFVFAPTVVAADAFDCIILKEGYSSLDDLPKGAVIATGSPRRKAQLLAYRPDFEVVGIRGNVETRIRKFRELNYDGIVLAKAGLDRLNLSFEISQVFDCNVMIPACGQGVLALEVVKDSEVLALIEKFADKKATQRLLLERAYLKATEGTCHLPIGAYADIQEHVTFYALYGNEKGDIVKKCVQLTDENQVEQVQQIAKQMMEEIHYG